MSLASSDDASEAVEDSDVDDVTMNPSFDTIFNAYVDKTLQKVKVSYRSGGSKIYNVHDGRERRALREFVQKSTPGTSWEMLPLKRDGKQHSYAKGFDPGPELRTKNTRNVHDIKEKDSDDDEFACFENKDESKDASESDENGKNMDSDSNDSEYNNGDAKPRANTARRKLTMRKNIGKSNYANNANNDSEEENKGEKKRCWKRGGSRSTIKVIPTRSLTAREIRNKGKKRSCWQRKIE